jgi:hypothetical protein
MPPAPTAAPEGEASGGIDTDAIVQDAVDSVLAERGIERGESRPEVVASGPTVDDAIAAGLAELGLDRAEADIEVIEEPDPAKFGPERGQGRVLVRRRRSDAAAPAAEPTPSAPPPEPPGPVAVPAQPAEPSRADLTVAADGTGDCLTIAEAVDRAPPMALIRVRPGTYPQRVALRRPVELFGDGDPATIRIEVPDWYGLESEDTEARVTGLTIASTNWPSTVASSPRQGARGCGSPAPGRTGSPPGGPPSPAA